MLSTKDLKYQIIGRRTEKLIKRFVESYKIKKIVLLNAVKLKLSSIVKIHQVVNVSRIQEYVGQVKGQRKEQQAPVIIEGKEEYEIERRSGQVIIEYSRRTCDYETSVHRPYKSSI